MAARQSHDISNDQKLERIICWEFHWMSYCYNVGAFTSLYVNIPLSTMSDISNSNPTIIKKNTKRLYLSAGLSGDAKIAIGLASAKVVVVDTLQLLDMKLLLQLCMCCLEDACLSYYWIILSDHYSCSHPQVSKPPLQLFFRGILCNYLVFTHHHSTPKI